MHDGVDGMSKKNTHRRKSYDRRCPVKETKDQRLAIHAEQSASPVNSWVEYLIVTRMHKDRKDICPHCQDPFEIFA
jgi:hypothetical protein